MSVKVKNKRGIKIQNRIIISGLLLIAQFLLLFLAAFTLSKDFIVIYSASEVLAIILVMYIVNRRSNPSYKIAWVVFILAFPIFGISLFLLWGGGRVFPYIKRRYHKCEEKYKSILDTDDSVHRKLVYDDYMHSRQSDYLAIESGYPVYDGTSVEYLSPGEKFLPRFLDELRAAKKYIYIEFFIIAEGVMWDSVYEILKQKAAQGVEVKVLFDDVGSIKRQHKDFIVKLKKDGINVAIFNKVSPTLNVFMNNRNHRKIVVIDGNVAITGGLNLADEYINEFKRFGYWLDCAVILKGNAVKSFLAMFCTMWEFTTGNAIDIKSHISDTSVSNSGFVQPYCDDPLTENNPAEGIYMQIINTAQRYVYITSPYLIIDNTMITVLKLAAKSGIDVRIITPHIPDKWYVHPVTQYNYLELLEAGVRIYEYTPGFIHSKLFISDDRVATIGTVNMDYRSFAFHFECGVWVSDAETASTIRRDFDSVLEESKEIKLEKWRKSSVFARLKRAILHIFSPFM